MKYLKYFITAIVLGVIVFSPKYDTKNLNEEYYAWGYTEWEQPKDTENVIYIGFNERKCFPNGLCAETGPPVPRYEVYVSPEEKEWGDYCEKYGYPYIRTKHDEFLGCTKTWSFHEPPVFPHLTPNQ